MGEMKRARTGGTRGAKKKNINLHHPMTNQFLYENGTQAADRNRENSARVVLRSSYSRAFIFSSLFVFDLRIGLSPHLLHGAEAYPLLTNAEECSQSPNV